VLVARGFFVVQTNESKVLTLFGRYVGSVADSGWHWTNPFATRRSVSRRVRNFNSERLKVNDANGSPVEIAAVIVWRVVDTAQALFDVDDFVSFVGVQSETALRALAGMHPYDSADDRVTLLGHQAQVAADLARHLQERLHVAGVEVIEARLTYLAYAPEIAQAMLRRQQAEAIVAARQTIVDGALGMVHMALNNLAHSGLLDLDEEKKAAMVNNLMVVLASDQSAQPVVNAGTLYV
jgi:regulator of protease activity HflC (stomatin/prohibitin superfamily)